MEALIRFLETHALACFYKNAFGMDCPGCGMQRAFILLLKGDLYNSILTYPPLPAFLLLFSLLGAHLVFRFRNGGTYLICSFFFTAIAVLGNFIYRLIQHT